MALRSLSASGFFLRWVFALVLVIVTFNPTRWSYAGCLPGETSGDRLPLKAPIDDLVTAAKVMAPATLRLLGVPA